MEPEPWESKYERIRAQYVVYGAQCASELESAIDTLEHDGSATDALKTLYIQFHKLAGSAGSYGFTQISLRSLEAELSCRALMDGATPVGSTEIEHWRDCVSVIRRELAEVREQMASGSPDATPK